jgi:uncharacterized protein YecA (UPF0149 family)
MNETQMRDEMEELRIAKGFPKLIPYRRPYDKIGRNEKCPCGSGKKYKKCCLFNKKG